ncbi:MAG: LCP family protein [Microbacteriaceae bacterium]|nr:LCP family protein [Microbacteriaceae bacterium]
MFEQKRSWWKIGLGSIAAVTLVLAGFVGFNVWQLSRTLDSAAVEVFDLDGSVYEDPTPEEINGPLNILVLGSDTRENQNANYGSSTANLADVIMLLHVNEARDNAVVMSFPRDLLIPIPDCIPEEDLSKVRYGDQMQINQTLDLGGPSCVLDAVQKLSGISIPHLGLIDFKGVIGMSEAIGGVEVCVANPIDDPYSQLTLDAGTHLLEGEQALAFLRTRYGVGDGSDLSRISNQQVFLTSLARKVMDEDILTSPIRLYSLATAAAENMRLSASLTKLDTMVAMARELNDVDLESISFLKLPVYDLEGDAVGRLGLAEGAEDIFSAIRDEEELLVEDGKLIDPDSIKEPNINPETGESTPSPTTTTNVDGVTAADELCSN